MDERQLAQWELMTDQLLDAAQARPWHVRHARKLIGAAAVLVAVSLAFFSYYAWRLPAQRVVPAAPVPVTAVPESAPVAAPAAVPAAGSASPAAPAPARATVPARSAAPAAPTAAPAATTAAPAVQPAAVAPRATISRGIPAVAPYAAPSTGRRVPAVTHTLPDDPAPEPAAAVAVTAPAAAAPPVAAPGDCPDAIVALGLCASHARKGMK